VVELCKTTPPLGDIPPSLLLALLSTKPVSELPLKPLFFSSSPSHRLHYQVPTPPKDETNLAILCSGKRDERDASGSQDESESRKKAGGSRSRRTGLVSNKLEKENLGNE